MKLLLLLFSGLKFGKLLTTGGTMLVSLIVYAFVYGWRYAAGFIALLFIHEMGHYLAARYKGLDVGAPTFIPFVGVGGPFLGTVGATCCYLLARSYEADWLLAVCYAGFFLNLFNLIPLSPFDGGRITAVLSPRIWLIGAPILVALFLYRPSPMLILI